MGHLPKLRLKMGENDASPPGPHQQNVNSYYSSFTLNCIQPQRAPVAFLISLGSNSHPSLCRASLRGLGCPHLSWQHEGCGLVRERTLKVLHRS